MKRSLLILSILFFVILLIIAFSDQVIRITIVLPKDFVPYYEWLIDFPGWQPALPEPAPKGIRMDYA
jgi:hypothetical protein